MALRNHPEISVATRDRVKKLAAELGYRRNPWVASLMSQVRSGRQIQSNEVLAFLTSHDGPDEWKRNDYIMQCFESALSRAENAGFRLQPFWLGQRAEKASAVSKLLWARGVRGALLAPCPVPHLPINVDWQRLAIATIGYSFTHVAVHRAAHHHVNGILTAYRELRARGYNRVGFVSTLQDMVRVQYYYLAGLLASQQLHGGAVIPPLTYASPMEERSFSAWFEEWRPDVVISPSRDAYRWLLKRGLRIPSDVGFACLHAKENRAFPHIAGIDQFTEQIGPAAVDLVVGQLSRNETGLPEFPLSVLLDGSWVDGRTVRRMSAAKADQAV